MFPSLRQGLHPAAMIMASNPTGTKVRTPAGRFLSRFQRVTSSGNFISEIDGLRFIAIGTVVIFHLAVGLALKSPLAYAMPTEGNFIASIARHGFRGVELFFIISGFILAYPFASHYLKGKSPVRMKQYFLRRLTRLEPPYILCLLLLFFVMCARNGSGFADLLPHLEAGLIYCHNLIFRTDNPVNNVAWSLEIEVQFYILVPLLSRIFAVRNTSARRSIIAGIAIASVLDEWLFISPESWMYLTIIRFLHFFMIGFLLADIYIIDWQENPVKNWRWDVVTLVGWPLLFMLWNSPELSRRFLPYGNTPVLSAILFPALALFLYQAVFRGSLTNRIMTTPIITTIGGMCYTIYLFHNQLIGALTGLTKNIVPTQSYTVNVIAQAIIVLPVMLAATAVYFVLIERPCMRKDWPRRAADKIRGLVARPAVGVKDAINRVPS
jgi:peptidoglycan/LPS O-acetylase OafA/YrhL